MQSKMAIPAMVLKWMLHLSGSSNNLFAIRSLGLSGEFDDSTRFTFPFHSVPMNSVYRRFRLNHENLSAPKSTIYRNQYFNATFGCVAMWRRLEFPAKRTPLWCQNDQINAFGDCREQPLDSRFQAIVDDSESLTTCHRNTCL